MYLPKEDRERQENSQETVCGSKHPTTASKYGRKLVGQLTKTLVNTQQLHENLVAFQLTDSAQN